MESVNCCARGFTLLEVLVLVAVLAIASAFVVPNLFPDEQRVLQREAARLGDAMQHAALTAQWQGEYLAWGADPEGYRFYRRASGATAGASNEASGWVVLEDDDVLLPHRMPSGAQVALLRVGLQPPRDTLFLFRPDGANEPYTIVVSGTQSSYTIAGDPLNRAAVARVGP